MSVRGEKSERGVSVEKERERRINNQKDVNRMQSLQLVMNDGSVTFYLPLPLYPISD
jgi:hypothetical protein